MNYFIKGNPYFGLCDSCFRFENVIETVHINKDYILCKKCRKKLKHGRLSLNPEENMSQYEKLVHRGII